MHGARPFRTTRRNVQNFGGDGRKYEWYRIHNTAGDSPAIVDLYDEIGLMGAKADQFIGDLRGVQGDLEMHINSPGGDVFDAIAIYNYLRSRPGNVAVVVDGLAASAASFIAQAASPGQLEMAPHATMMIHDGFGAAIGNAADMREMADLLDKASDNIAGIYADRTGKPAGYWRDQMRAETWYSDDQAVMAGLADKVRGKAAPAQDWDLSVFPNWPGNTTTAEVVNASVDNSPWDGGKAMSNGAASDDPAKFYAGICAGRRDGDPSKQASWALPYKYTPSSAPNAAGVRNALSRLPQTEGLTNKAEAQALLERLMKQINPDHETDNSFDPALLISVLTSALEGGVTA